MASRAKKKGKVSEKVNIAQLRQASIDSERDSAIKKNRLLYTIICSILLAAIIIVMIPYNNAGIINVKLNGKFTFSLGDSYDFDISIDAPINTIEVIFAPKYTTSTSKFILIKVLRKIKKDYDISTLHDGSEYLRELGFSQSKIDGIEGSAAAAYALCWLIVITLIALIVTSVICMCGKSGMLPPFICALIYTVLAIVQLGIGIYVIGMGFSSSDLSLTLVTGAQTYVNLFAGLALSIITAVFAKRRKGILAQYGNDVSKGGKQ